ncbi:MAG: hypothetical protein ACD_77C00265G0001 [uncultured bacterium]|nr:MAG: hypothetical protein ACD_77C00265G0001 [uncultured bacterium]
MHAKFVWNDTVLEYIEDYIKIPRNEFFFVIYLC